MSKAYTGILSFGRSAQEALLGGLAAYGTARDAYTAGAEILAAGRGLYMAAGPAAAGAAMLAV